MIERLTTVTAESDGGMTGGAAAAIRYFFAENGHLYSDVEIGVSVGVLNAASCIAKNHHEAWRVWTQALAHPDIVSMNRPGKFIDRDKVVDGIRYPFHEKALELADDTRFFFGTTRTASRKPKYFTNEDVRKGVKPHEIFRAAISIPGLTGEPVDVGGELHEDGVGSIEFEDIIRMGLELGDTVIAIDNRDREKQKKLRQKFPSSGWTDKVVLLQPESKAWMMTNDTETLEESFHVGEAEARKAMRENPLLQGLFAGMLTGSRRRAA